MLLFGVSLTYPWSIKLEKQNFKHLLKISSFALLKLLQEVLGRGHQLRVVCVSLPAYDICLWIRKRESSSVGPYSGLFPSVSATKGILLQRKTAKEDCPVPLK